MKITDFLPPETLTLRLSGETMEKLRLIQASPKDSKVAWKLEELAAKLFDRFLAETDLEGIAESPRQPRSKRPGTPAEVNGASISNG